MPKSFVQGATRVEVIVRKDDGVSDEKQPQGARTGDGGDSGGATSKSSFNRLVTGGKNKKAMADFYAQMAFNNAKKIIGFYTSTAGDRNGDKALQSIVDRQIEIADDTLSSLLTVGITTAKFGLVGLAVSSVATGAGLVMKYAARKHDYDVQIFKENQNIQYMRARAGINLTNGRLR